MKEESRKAVDFKITASKLKNGLCQRTESQARMEGWLANKELLTELKHKKEANTRWKQRQMAQKKNTDTV